MDSLALLFLYTVESYVYIIFTLSLSFILTLLLANLGQTLLELVQTVSHKYHGQSISLLRTSEFQDKARDLWTLSFVKMWFLPLREFGKYPVALLLLHKTVNTEVLGTTPLAIL